MSNLNVKYKVQKSIPWQVMDDAVIILSPNTKMAHELDETGSFVWMAMTQAQSLDEIAIGLTKEYDVAIEEAQKDVAEFIHTLESNQLVEAQ